MDQIQLTKSYRSSVYRRGAYLQFKDHPRMWKNINYLEVHIPHPSIFKDEESLEKMYLSDDIEIHNLAITIINEKIKQYYTKSVLQET